MKGFEITYKDENGKVDRTFFGVPIASPGIKLPADVGGVVALMFYNSYPDRDILAMKACTLAEYEGRS